MDRNYSLAELDLDEPRQYGAPWPGDVSRLRGAYGPQFSGERPASGLSRVSVRPVGGSPFTGRQPAARPPARERKAPRRRPGPAGPGGRGPGEPGGPGDDPQPGRSRRRTIVRWMSIVITLVLVAASLAAYIAYRNVVDGIHQIDVSRRGSRAR